MIFILLLLHDFGGNRPSRKGKLTHLIANIKEIRPIIPFAALLFLAQFFMQPLFHYWQPLFKEQFDASPNEMSFIFIGYSLAMSSISWGYSRLTHFAHLRSSWFVIGIALMGSAIYSLIGRSSVFNLSLILFALTFGVFNLVQIAVGVLVQNQLRSENRMIITKYISLFSRFGMIISLVFVHLLFANDWATPGVYKLYGTFAVVVFGSYLGWMIMQKKGEKKYVS